MKNSHMETKKRKYFVGKKKLKKIKLFEEFTNESGDLKGAAAALSGIGPHEKKILDIIEDTIFNKWTDAVVDKTWQELVDAKIISASEKEPSIEEQKDELWNFFNKEVFPPSAKVHDYFSKELGRLLK